MITRRLLALTGASALASALALRSPAVLAQDPPAVVPVPVVPVAVVRPAAVHKAIIAASQQKLAQELITRLAADKPGTSINLSPMSAFLALAIVAQGGDEHLRQSMHDALQFKHGKPVPSGMFAAVLAELTQVIASPLMLANGLVLDPAMKPVAGKVAELKALGIEVSEEALDTPEALKHINDWVSAKTKGLIPSILDEAPQSGGLVALNALYFKDRWKSPFKPEKTEDKPFTGIDLKESAVPMMRQDGGFRFRKGPSLIGIDLDFADPRFGLVIVTTTDKPATGAFLAKAANAWLLGQKFEFLPGSISMPRLQLETTNDLLAHLRSLGLKEEAKSLQGFGASAPRITAISQRAVLKLDEEGAEAAAATAVTAVRSIDNNHIQMDVNKPYLYALRDKSTGFVILAGYVARPGAAKA